MSTPPTGEDPHRGPSDVPTPPQQYGPPPAWGQQSPQPYGPGPHGGPPGYGQQPGYGQFAQQSATAWPPPAAQRPRDKKRRRLIFALEAVALAIVVGIATLVYVLSATVLDATAVERDVAAQFEQREGVALDLQCGQRMIVRPGADYECEGTTADGEEVEIRIEVTDDDGAYTWEED